MKLKVLSASSKVISFLLVLLGFSSCDIIDPKDEYGTPTAKFRVKGQVVDKVAESKGISGMKVAVGYPYTDDQTYYIDSIVTDNTGTFDLSVRDFPSSQKFVIKYEDTSISREGNYGLTIDTVRFENPSFTHGEGNWYKGEAVKDLGKVELSPKENE